MFIKKSNQKLYEEWLTLEVEKSYCNYITGLSLKITAHDLCLLSYERFKSMNKRVDECCVAIVSGNHRHVQSTKYVNAKMHELFKNEDNDYFI